MISSVRSNMPSFKAVEFTPGFNVILADRTKESTRGDSRNGLGKTTLFEVVHFCLGAGTRRNRGLLVAPLKGWTFTLELQIEDRSLAVTRSTDQPMRTVPWLTVIPFKTAMPPMSISVFGLANRSLSKGIRLWPPAISLAPSWEPNI